MVYNPNELRDSHGRWARAGAGFKAGVMHGGELGARVATTSLREIGGAAIGATLGGVVGATRGALRKTDPTKRGKSSPKHGSPEHIKEIVTAAIDKEFRRR